MATNYLIMKWILNVETRLSTNVETGVKMEQCGGERCQDKLDFSQLSWHTGKGRNGWGSLGWFSLFDWAAKKVTWIF